MTANPERTLPHNLDAERSVLGAILVTSGKAMDDVSDRLDGREFYRDAHRRIFKAMRALHEKSEPIDLVTLKNELARVGDLDECGGPAYISDLDNGVPRATNIRYYSDIVREKSSKREVIFLANKLLTAAYEDEDNPGAIVDMAERGLLQISEHAEPGELVSVDQMVQQVMPKLAELHERKRPITGLSTGIRKLDHLTRGLQPGTLNLLAARTSQGKSTLAGQLALHMSASVPVAFFSLEMTREELLMRMLATQARVDGHDLLCGQLGMVSQQDVGLAAAEISGRRLWVDESADITPMQVRSRVRRLKARHGLGLIVIDYLQLMEHPKPQENNERRVAATSKSLRIMAKELGVPILALSQLSRAPEKRQDQRPVLSDLRESGALEQDAHVVLLLYKPEPTQEAGVRVTPPTELILAKQRNGPKGTVELRWLSEQYRYEEIA